MREPDRREIFTAMVKDITDQMDNRNYYIIPKNQVTDGATIMTTVWKMNRKRDIKERAIKKWKALLNVYGYRMKNGVNYKKTYAPVVYWN